MYLLNDDGNPYVGDLIHEPPVNLYVYKLLIQYTFEYLPCVFIICDVCTAFLLYLVTNKYLQLSYERQTKALEENKKYVDSLDDARKEEIKKECQKSDDNLFLTPESIKLPPTYVFAAYLFNPYIIFNCVAMTTTVFSNMFLAVFLCSLVLSKFNCFIFKHLHSHFFCFRSYICELFIFGLIDNSELIFRTILSADCFEY